MSEALEQNTTPSTKVLIVDDNAENRDLLRRHLEMEGYHAEMANGGQAALSMIAENDYDLILLDSMMPEMNGTQVLTTLRKKFSKTALPIIMVTAKSESQDVVKALKEGANDYITKPINFDVAIARIQSALEWKEAQDILIKANREIQKTAQAKSRFLSNMSHEIRTPLNSIIGLTDILIDTELSNEQKKYVNACQKAGENLLVLINDILDLSKIESGELSVERYEFCLEEVTKDVCEILQTKCRRENLTLSRSIADNLNRTVKGDGNRIKQVLFNLLGNSIKFTQRGEIRLSAENE